MHFLKSRSGQSIAEVILALAFFGFIVGALLTMSASGIKGINRGADHGGADALAEEGVEAVRAIRDASAWNQNTYTQSGVAIDANAWKFLGEGTSETIGKYTRAIRFSDVCRDSSGEITDCPGAYTDVHSKLVDVEVSWLVRQGLTNSVKRSTYITNWDSREFTQTDWSGGAGQAVWTNANMYDSDDGSLVTSVPGQLSLRTGSYCGLWTFGFDNASEYVFNPVKIEVASGSAKLKDVGGGSYATDKPSVLPNSSYTPASIGGWVSFVETAAKNGGEIYYQLSDDNGARWQYFDGVTWTLAGSSDYNTAGVVNANISTFPVTNRALLFKAFLGSNGTQLVSLDTIAVQCVLYNNVTFDFPAEYTYDSSRIVVAGGSAELAPIGTAVSGLTGNNLQFDTESGQDPDMIYISGTVYAIAYESKNEDGFVKTVSIDASGSISSATIDSLEFDKDKGKEPSIVLLSGNVYAIAYRGKNDEGYVKTMTIDASGAISNTALDTLQFDAKKGKAPKIIHVSGEVFAVAYQGDSDDGFVKTIKIQSNGSIDDAVIDTLEFDAQAGKDPDFLRVSGNTYALAYEGNSEAGMVKTITIDSAGLIGDSVIGALQFDSTGQTSKIIQVAGEVYAIAYSGSGDDGFVKTIRITAGGAIQSTVISTLEFDTAEGREPSIRFVSGQIYAIAYRGSSDDGFVATFSISSAGAIQSSVLDRFEFDVKQAYKPILFPVSSGVFALAYRGANDDGYLITMQVDGSGAVSRVLNGILEFDIQNGENPSLVHVSGDVYAIAYRGQNNEGYVATVSIGQNGQIGGAVIDRFRYYQNTMNSPDMIQVFGDIFVIAQQGTQGIPNAGSLLAIRIGADGIIQKSVISTVLFDAGIGKNPDLIHVSGDIFAVAYTGSGDDGYVKAFKISANGIIQASALDSLEFDTQNGVEPSIVPVAGTVYAIAYQGQTDDGVLATVEITAAGNISNAVIDSYIFDTQKASTPHSIHLASDKFAIVYTDNNNDGFLITVTINPSGTIVKSIVSTLEFDPSDGLAPRIIPALGSAYIVAYTGPSDDGFAKLIDVADTGIIAATPLDTLEFDPLKARAVDSADVGGGFFAVAYQGKDDDGYLATFKVTNSNVYPGDRPAINPVASFFAPTMSGWHSFGELAYKDGGGQVYYQLSADDGLSWLYFNGSSWASAVGADYNTADAVNAHISVFPSITKKVMFKAFLASDGSELVALDTVSVGWTQVTGIQYAINGYAISSAFYLGDSSPVQAIEWEENIPVCVSDCLVQFQIQTAQDNGGVPGAWALTWAGPQGDDGDESDAYSVSRGQMVHVDSNGFEWMRYKALLVSDGLRTPILEKVGINYK